MSLQLRVIISSSLELFDDAHPLNLPQQQPNQTIPFCFCFLFAIYVFGGNDSYFSHTFCFSCAVQAENAINRSQTMMATALGIKFKMA